MRAATPWIVSLSVRLYQWLLSMGPAEFRCEYTEPTVQVFRECCRDAYRQRGMWGVMLLWLPLFSEAVSGMLAEHFGYRSERIRPMQPIVRRSMITTFYAFILFLLADGSLGRIADPSAPFDAIARLHPVVGIARAIITYSTDVAALTIVLGGLPMLFIAIKQAISEKRMTVFALFAIKFKHLLTLLLFSVGIVVVFIAYMMLSQFFLAKLPLNTNGAPLWMFFAGFAVMVAIVFVALSIATSLSLAIARSDFSEKMLRFALIPIAITTLAMGVALVAGIVWIVSLWVVAPQFAWSGDGLGAGGGSWVLAIVVAMLLATVAAADACRRGLRARPLLAA